MEKSEFILNDKKVEIESINYENGNISIIGKNPDCGINIYIKYDINLLPKNLKKDISNYIYLDQNFYTEKFSYVIEIKKDIYLTKKSYNNYLLELYLPKVEILIPPFDNINKRRVDLKEEELEIRKLELKVYFKV